MPTATLTEKGQVVIPAEIRARHGLTAGTQFEFVDDDGVIRLLVRRRVAPSDPRPAMACEGRAPQRRRATPAFGV